MFFGSTARIAVVAALFFSAACVDMQPLPTRTGKPEVMFKGKGIKKKMIVDKAAYYLISEGYKIERVDDYAAVFIKHGTTWRYVNNQSVEEARDERVTLNLLDSAEGINVVGTVETVNYPGGRGPVVEDDSKFGERAQWLFNLLWRVDGDLTGNADKGMAGR